MNIIVPPLGAYIISIAGGIQYIKHIFLIQFIASIVVLIYILKKLEVKEVLTNEHNHLNPLKTLLQGFMEMRDLLKSSNARIILQIVLISALAWSLPGPYWRLYAYEVCKTPTYLMGLLATAQSLTYSIFSIPISRRADGGRKKDIIMKLRMFYWFSVISLLIAGTVETPYNYIVPILAWALWGIGATLSSAWRSLAIESVPEEWLARWNSLRNFSYYLVAIPCYLLSGYLWNLDPRLPFSLALVIDLIMTVTLLPRISEQSKSKLQSSRILNFK